MHEEAWVCILRCKSASRALCLVEQLQALLRMHMPIECRSVRCRRRGNTTTPLAECPRATPGSATHSCRQPGGKLLLHAQGPDPQGPPGAQPGQVGSQAPRQVRCHTWTAFAACGCAVAPTLRHVDAWRITGLVGGRAARKRCAGWHVDKVSVSATDRMPDHAAVRCECHRSEPSFGHFLQRYSMSKPSLRDIR